MADMIIISAMGRNHVIGSGGGMPWEVPEEYQHFQDTTRDQILIMGRKSFEIFGPTLTCEHCYVITRDIVVQPTDHAVISGSLCEVRGSRVTKTLPDRLG